MNYQIELKPRAIKDLKALPASDQRRIMGKIESLRDNLAVDAKKLTHFSPEYRLRVGDYRILFEATGIKVVIYRVLHRREAYN